MKFKGLNFKFKLCLLDEILTAKISFGLMIKARNSIIAR